MDIKINENTFSGLIKYCSKNKIELQKIAEESILQNQLRHNIDQEGNNYEDKDCKYPDKNIFKNLLKSVVDKNDPDIKNELFGRVYENIGIKDYNYLIGDYLENFKVIFITNNNKMLDNIKNCKEIRNIKIEKSQAYSWAATYKTKVIYTDMKDCIIVLLDIN